MTDDALEAKDRRIAELRKEADMMHSEYKTARARIEELTAALKPFAAVYDENYALIGKWHDGGIQGLLLSDLRAARAAYRGEKE